MGRFTVTRGDDPARWKRPQIERENLQAVMNSFPRIALFLLYTLLVIAGRGGTRAQTSAAVSPADWPTYNHDLAGWRFNPAEKTLGRDNVGKLVEKWRFPAVGTKESVGVVQATPSVVAGEVYFGTATFPAF